MKAMQFLFVIAALAAAGSARADTFGRAQVIDANTLDVGNRLVRLYGIDAPDEAQSCTRAGRPWPCGRNAAFALADLVGRHWVRCVESKSAAASESSPAAVCYLDTIDINAEMVRRGWALALGGDAGAAYRREEAEARQARRGLWSGEFEKPAAWRRARRPMGAPTPGN